MKKIICFALLLSFISNLNGQWQPQKDNILPETIAHRITPSQMNYFNKDQVHIHNDYSNFVNTKSSQWKWDTIFVYDTVGLLARYSQTFDTHGNVLIFVIERWQGNAWEKVRQYTYNYDSTGNILTRFDDSWYNNVWIYHVRDTYTYDLTGNVLTDLNENWQSNIWVNTEKYTYAYDLDGNLLNYLNENWQNNTWANHSRLTYTYNSNGNNLTELFELWQNNVWANYYIYSYTYDSNGNMLTELWEMWQSNAWVNYRRFTYSYDMNGKMLTDLNEKWENNTWVNYFRDSYSYDVSGNMHTDLYEYWDNNAWGNFSNKTYSYDTNGNSITGKFEKWQSGNWEPGLGHLSFFPPDQYLSNFFFYRYEANYTTITGIADLQTTKSNLSVFPNPVNEMITVEYHDLIGKKAGFISIYNLSGKLLIQQPLIQLKSEINLNRLATGTYLLEARCGNEINRLKFVKK